MKKQAERFRVGRMGLRHRDRDRQKTLCLVCSMGGHLEEMRRLADIVGDYDKFLIVSRSEICTLKREASDRIYIIANINEGRGLRNPIKLLQAFVQTCVIFLRERPTVVVSTGAGVAIPAFLLSWLFRKPSLFIESFARVRHPSKAGRICYRLASEFFVQHESLLAFYPQARYVGSLYRHL